MNEPLRTSILFWSILIVGGAAGFWSILWLRDTLDTPLDPAAQNTPSHHYVVCAKLTEEHAKDIAKRVYVYTEHLSQGNLSFDVVLKEFSEPDVLCGTKKFAAMETLGASTYILTEVPAQLQPVNDAFEWLRVYDTDSIERALEINQAKLSGVSKTVGWENAAERTVRGRRVFVITLIDDMQRANSTALHVNYPFKDDL
jgi:hypothetical protein